MTRKDIIAVLTLATVGSVWVWVASYGAGGLTVWREFDSSRTTYGFLARESRCGFVRFVMPQARWTQAIRSMIEVNLRNYSGSTWTEFRWTSQRPCCLDVLG